MYIMLLKETSQIKALQFSRKIFQKLFPHMYSYV